MFGSDYANAWQAMAAAASAGTITRTVTTPIPIAQQAQDEPFPPAPVAAVPDELREPPRPSQTSPIQREVSLERLDPNDRSRLAQAVLAARRTLPPALAELIEREIGAWVEFAFQFDNKALLSRVVTELLAGSEPGSRAA